MSIIAIGIDPGLANVGLATVGITGHDLRVHGLKVLRTEKTKRKVPLCEDNERRLRILVRELSAVLRIGVDIVCMEAMSTPRNAVTAKQLALCWGAIITLTDTFSIPLIQVTPQEIKEAVTGTKNASKHAMSEALQMHHAGLPALLSIIPASRQEHPLDALGAVVAAEHHPLMQTVLGVKGKV